MEEKINKQLKTLSKILFELRESSIKDDGKCLTQKEVAEMLGVRYQSYQAYERGVSYPSIQNFLKLAEIFDVSLEYLVGKKDI